MLAENDSNVRARLACCLPCMFESHAGLDKSRLRDATYCGGRRGDGSVGNLVITKIRTFSWWSVVADRQNDRGEGQREAR